MEAGRPSRSDGDGPGDNGDFLPRVNGNVFHALVIIAPCVTAVLITLIVTRARRSRASMTLEKAEDALREDGMAEKPENKPPLDPMAPQWE